MLTGSLNGFFYHSNYEMIPRNEGNETFTLVLSNLQGASVFVGNGLIFSKTVTIVDDEIPTLKISNTELNVIENTLKTECLT